MKTASNHGKTRIWINQAFFSKEQDRDQPGYYSRSSLAGECFLDPKIFMREFDADGPKKWDSSDTNKFLEEPTKIMRKILIEFFIFYWKFLLIIKILK